MDPSLAGKKYVEEYPKLFEVCPLSFEPLTPTNTLIVVHANKLHNKKYCVLSKRGKEIHEESVKKTANAVNSGPFKVASPSPAPEPLTNVSRCPICQNELTGFKEPNPGLQAIMQLGSAYLNQPHHVNTPARLETLPDDVDEAFQRIVIELGFPQNDKRYDSALLELNKIIKKVPHFKALVLRAKILLDIGEYAKAFSHIKQALSLNKDNCEALLLHANICQHISLCSEARKSIENIQKQEPEYADIEPCLAMIRFRDKDENGAISVLDKLLGERSISNLTTINRAYIRKINKQYPEALTLLNRLTNELFYSVTALFYKAEIEFNLKDYAGAEDTLRQLFRIYSKHIPGLFLFGECKRLQDKTEEALKTYNELLAINDEHIQALTQWSALTWKNCFDNPKLISGDILEKILNRLEKVIGKTETPLENTAWKLRGHIHLFQKNDQAALVDFTKALEIDSKDAEARREKAHLKFKLNPDFLDEIVKDLNLVIQANPLDLSSRNMLAKILNKQAKYSDALDQIASLISNDKEFKFEEMHFLGARLYLTQNKLEEAFKVLETALKKWPDSIEGIECRGNIYKKRKEFDNALADFKWVADKCQGVVKARVLSLMGDVLFQQNKIDEALNVLEESIKLDPHSALTISRLGACAYKTSKPDLKKALDYLQRSLNIDSEDLFVLLHHGEVSRLLEDKKSSFESFNKVLKKDPNNGFAYSRRGYLYYEKEEFSLACDDFVEALDKELEEKERNFALTYRAASWIGLGKPKLAQPDLIEVLKSNKNDLLANALFGEVHRLKENFEEAINLLTYVLEKDPNNLYARTRRGAAYRQCGKFDSAIEDLKNIDNLFANACLGSTYLDKKDYDQAISFFEKALMKNPNDIFSLTHLGESYRKRSEQTMKIDMGQAFNDLEKARFNFAKTNEMLPNNSFVLMCQGTAHYQLYDFKKAISSLTTVIEDLTTKVNRYTKKVELSPEDKSIQSKKDTATTQLITALTYRGLSFYKTLALKKALADFDEILKLNPQNDEIRKHKAIIYLFEKNYELAREELKALNNEDVSVLGILAATLLLASQEKIRVNKNNERIEEIDLAYNALNKALEINKDDFLALFVRSSLHRVMNKKTEALRDLNSLLNIDPLNYFCLAAHGSLTPENKSVGNLIKVINSDPDDIFALLQRGKINLSSGLIDEAKKDFIHVIQLDSKNPSAHLGLAKVYLSEKQFELSKVYMKNFDKYKEQSDNPNGFSHSWSDLENHIKMSILLLDSKGLNKNIENHQAFLVYRGRLYYSLGKYHLALKDFTKAIQSGALSNEEVLLSRGEVYIKLHQWQKALEDFNTALEINSKNVSALGLCGLAHLHLQKFSDAAIKLKEALDIDPTNNFAKTYLCQLYSLQEMRPETILKLATEVIESPVADLELKTLSYILRAKVKARNSNPAGAINDLTEALALNPKNSLILSERGYLYMFSEKTYELAIQDLEQALEIDPTNKKASDDLVVIKIKSAELNF